MEIIRESQQLVALLRRWEALKGITLINWYYWFLWLLLTISTLFFISYRLVRVSFMKRTDPWRTMNIYICANTLYAKWDKVQWASYQIRKIAGCACAGNAGNLFSPPPRLFPRFLTPFEYSETDNLAQYNQTNILYISDSTRKWLTAAERLFDHKQICAASWD